MSERTRPNDDPEARLEAFRSALNAREKQLLDIERRVASERLATRQPTLVLEAAANALASSEELRRHHLEVLQPTVQIACHDGCHWCCHLKVSVTAPEVFAIAEYLENSAPKAVLEHVRARAAELAKDPRIFSSEAKAEAHIPCAMLSEQGGCSVYAARPLTCRGYNALDSESCRRMLDDDQEFVASNEQWARECAAVGLGLLAAIGDAGLPAQLLELTSAVHLALSEPNAVQRWLAGEPIFAAALADAFFVDHRSEDAECRAMTEYVVTKQGATSDWGSNAEGEVQEMPLSKPDGAGWKLHSVVPSQYNVMAIWEREEKRKKR